MNLYVSMYSCIYMYECDYIYAPKDTWMFYYNVNYSENITINVNTWKIPNDVLSEKCQLSHHPLLERNFVPKFSLY